MIDSISNSDGSESRDRGVQWIYDMSGHFANIYGEANIGVGACWAVS